MHNISESMIKELDAKLEGGDERKMKSASILFSVASQVDRRVPIRCAGVELRHNIPVN